MPMITPLPSPRGTNHERVFILKCGARRSPTAAYDSKGRHPGLAYDDVDPVNELFGWITQNLDDAAQNRLIEMLASKPSRPAQDDEAAPSLDPNSTRAGVNWSLQRKRQLNAGGSAMDSKRRRQIAQDAHFGSVMKAAFARPGSATYDAREKRKIAADAATMKSLEARFPHVAKITVHAETVDRNAGPHRLATDSSINARLDALYGPVKHAI